MHSSDRFEEFKNDGDQPTIRTFNGGAVAAEEPMGNLPGEWIVCSSETIGDFSGVAYHFGRALSDELDVPIGLINISWGGSRAEAWIRPRSLKSTDIGQRAFATWESTQEQMNADPLQWAATEVDDSEWLQGQAPGNLESFGIADEVDGIFWERIPITIPKSWEGRDLSLSLGGIDDDDTTFINGVRIGATRGWQTPRNYVVPAHMVREGESVLAIRIIDGAGPGGMHGVPEDLYMHPQDDPSDRRSISGPARVVMAGEASDIPLQHRPSHLYHGMLHPLLDIGCAGVIWYQGENNAMGPGSAEEYSVLLPMLITDWREALGKPSLPFLIVQIANLDYRVPDWDFPLIRDIQRRALTLPATGLAVTTDIGDAADIHPRNKHDVGDRLARWALVDSYGIEDIVKSGPLVRAVRRDRGGIVVEFDTFGSPIQGEMGSPVGGFQISFSDDQYVDVPAEVSSNQTVRIRIPRGSSSQPKAVRYGWRPDPVNADLFNREGLPAASFEMSIASPRVTD